MQETLCQHNITNMDISSCFSLPHNRLVNPQTEYERACDVAFINASAPVLKKKPSSFLDQSSHSQKKNSDIVLDGKPHFSLESAVENDELV